MNLQKSIKRELLFLLGKIIDICSDKTIFVELSPLQAGYKTN